MTARHRSLYVLIMSRLVFLFFFFQAEDGIRDGTVTGVQTCAFRSGRAVERQLLFQTSVLVPELAALPLARFRMIYLHHAHPALHEPPSHQTLSPEDLGRLLVDRKSVV